MKRHLAAFPKERDLLSRALHGGVPEAVAKHAADLPRRTADFAAATGVPADEALWAVHAWAATVGPSAAPVPVLKVRRRRSNAVAVSALAERRIMAGIAALGGMLGGGVGNGALLLLMDFGTGGGVKYRVTRDGVPGDWSDGGGSTALVMALMVALSVGLGALLGGAGAALGWWMGRGDERPWAGFRAAWGAGMGTGCLFLFITGPGPITAVIIAVATFGATYTTAARGGRSD